MSRSLKVALFGPLRSLVLVACGRGEQASTTAAAGRQVTTTKAGEPAKVPIALSFEKLPELDADLLFWQIRQRDEDGSRDVAGLQVAKDNPLWARMPAVDAGMVFEVDNRPWYFPTILASRQMLDDIEGALL